MSCTYCSKPAVGLDLCHASHPVCADHAHGHQLGALPSRAEPKSRKEKPE